LRLSKRRKKRSHVIPGSSPGQIIIPPESPKPVISKLSYNQSEFSETIVESIEEIRNLPAGYTHWINLDGIGDAETIRLIGEYYQIHSLALEDIVSSHTQRPKLEEYDDSLFIVIRMPVFRDGKCATYETEQLSIFLSGEIVITFQEVPDGDPFKGVRERIRKSKGKIRSRKADYLSYAILDAAIDSFFPVIDERSDEIESVEAEILERPSSYALKKVHTLKQELIMIRRSLWPLREVLNSLIRDTSDRITDETKLFLRDCYDHTSLALDLTETYRELCSDLADLYLSNISNKLNEVMKFLTIITTIFVPLTFMVGVYGMNFDPDSSPWNMPELRSYYGYPIALLSMVIVAGVLLGFFRRRGWL